MKELRRASMLSVQLREYALANRHLKLPDQLRDRLKASPCCSCHMSSAPVDLHHFLGSVHGMKSADLFVVPVCRPCHTLRENDPEFRDECCLTWIQYAAGFLNAVANGHA